MKRRLILGLLFSSVLILQAEIKIDGYYKSFFIALFPARYEVLGNSIIDPAQGLLNNKIRLNFSANLSKTLNLKISYELSPGINSVNSMNNLFGDLQLSDYRFTDLDQRIFPGAGKEAGSLEIFNNLDRFCFTFNLPFADVYIGRQAISWGSGKFVNPTDILAPYSFNELDVEDRRGVDAVRVRIPLGTMDELDLGFVAGKDFKMDMSSFYLRGKFYVMNTDFSLILMGFHKNLMLGFDVTRAIGGAGSWIEAAFVIPDFFRESIHKTEQENYLRLSAGLDYNFRGGIYTFLEYHYSSAGSDDPEQYLEMYNKPAVTNGAVYLMGRHYLNLGVSFQLHPLIPFTGILIYNASDSSLIFAPGAEYNISENIYLAAGAYLTLGKQYNLFPHLIATDQPPIQLNSEFGAYPGMVYTSFRVYF